ncbi:hypothetical protein EMMF5_006536 [Cystobasidiomycetes sp. EMM_F5]
MAPSKRQFAQAAASNTEMRLPGRITRSGASRNLEVPMATGPFSGSGSPRGSSPASTIEEAPEASQTLQEAAAPGAVEEAAGPAEIGEKGTEVGSEVAEVPAEVGTELVPEVAGGPAVEGEAAANDVLDIADQDVNNVEAGEPIHHAEDAGLQLAQQEEQAPGGELPEEDMQGLQILLGGVVIPGAAALGPGPARIVAGKRVDGARCSRCLKTGVPERLCFPKAPTAPKGFANAPACCMRCSLKKEGKQCENPPTWGDGEFGAAAYKLVREELVQFLKPATDAEGGANAPEASGSTAVRRQSVPRRKSTTPATQVVATHRPAGWKKGKKRAARQSDDEEEQQEEEASSEAGKEYDEDLAPLGVGPKTGAQGRKRPRMGFVPNAPRPGGPARLAQEKWSAAPNTEMEMATALQVLADERSFTGDAILLQVLSRGLKAAWDEFWRLWEGMSQPE